MEALGPVLILFSIPLALRWIPPNRFYGFRVPVTCRNRDVWYEANARFARHCLLLGAALVALEFVLPATMRVPVLRVTATVSFIAILIYNIWMANRLGREKIRNSSGGLSPSEQ